MADYHTSLRLRTHNINGFENSKECLYQECEDASFDVLALQEHWLRPSFKKEKGTNKLKIVHPQFDGFATSGMSSHVGKSIIRGRPFGGTGFLFNKKMSKCLRARIDIKHERITVMELCTDKNNILLINAYMPYFKAANNDTQIAEYQQTLAFMQSILRSHPNHEYIIMMDMNCNIFNTSHPYSSLLHGIMNDYELVSNFSFIDNFDPTTEYTRFDLKKNSFTLIDGFLLSKCLSDVVQSSSIVHPHTNTSDHLPVELTINVKVEIFECKTSSLNFYIPWSTLTDSESTFYRETMSSALKNVSIPFHALNHSSDLCNDCNCFVALETFYESMVAAVKEADCSLPRRRHGLAKPFWTDELNDLKKKSFDAHRLWLSSDSPRSGPIYIEKIRTNSQYKLMLRKCKRECNNNISDDLANNLLSKDNNSFWKNWNKLKGGNVSSSSIIDGSISHDDIANTFASYFKSVYSKSNADDVLKQKFESSYNEYCTNQSNSLVFYLFSWDDMLDAAFKLKTGKATSTFMKAEHIFFSCPELLYYIHLLFNGLLSHSYMPQEFLCGTISPIIKDSNGDTTSPSNYRGITLGPVLLQLFENALLKKFGHFLESDNLQFAYKTSYSTAHAIFVLKSCVEYYNSHGSNVIVTMLDCSKAFDTISHYGIFLKLMNRGVPLCFLNLMIYWYLNMKGRCRWENAFSEYFHVSSGTKQGGILSPNLFTLYMNDLIVRLRNSGLGCHWLSLFMACIMYADDLCLLAPTRGAMQKLLTICVDYCAEFCLSFNVKKSKTLIFGKTDPSLITPLTLYSENIDFVPSWKYLGCTIVSGTKFTFSIASELSAFYCSANSILKSHLIQNELVLMNFLYSHCVPCLTNCAEVKDLTSADMHKCNVALNDSIRLIFSYNRWESTRFLRQQQKKPNIVEIFFSRKKTFVENIRGMSNQVVRSIMRHNLQNEAS